LMDEVEQLSKKPVDAQKLDEAKNTLIHQKKMDLRYSEHSSEVLGSEGLSGTLDYVSKYPEFINSVTPQDIQDYAKKYMDGSSYALVYALPGSTHLESDKTSSTDGTLPSFVPHAGMPPGSPKPANDDALKTTAPQPPSPTADGRNPIANEAKVSDETTPTPLPHA
jgi:hypothetical protein